MTELEKAIAIISAASSVEATAVAERLKSDDDATDIATEIFEPKYKAQRDQGDQRATMKTRKEVEKAFRANGVEDASFADLSGAIAALKGQAATASAKDLTEEQILNLPVVVNKLNTLKQSQEQLIEAARNEERTKLAEKEQAFTKAQTDAKIRAKAEELEAKLNPNYPAGRESFHRKKFIDELVALGDYKLDVNGEPQIVDEHGNLKDGKMGNPIKFEDRVREQAEMSYGLPASLPKTSPGLTPNDAALAGQVSDKKYQGDMPKTQADYATLLPTLTPEQAKEVQEWRQATKPF